MGLGFWVYRAQGIEGSGFDGFRARIFGACALFPQSRGVFNFRSLVASMQVLLADVSLVVGVVLIAIMV